jgi:hypothetical protein
MVAEDTLWITAQRKEGAWNTHSLDGTHTVIQRGFMVTEDTLWITAQDTLTVLSGGTRSRWKVGTQGIPRSRVLKLHILGRFQKATR